MTERYALSPRQVAVLRALHEGIVERSAIEVAVSALLLPDQAQAALGGLERMGLVSSWVPISGPVRDKVFILTDEGRQVYRALTQYKGTPAIGTVARLAHLPFSGWLSGQESSSYVEVIPEESDQ